MKHRIMTPQELNQIVQDLELKGWITLSATEPNNIVNVHPTAAYNRITDSNLKETSILMPIDLMRSEENIKAQLENLRDSIKKQAFNVALDGKPDDQPTVFHYPAKDEEATIIPKTIQQKAVVFMLNQANNIVQKLIEKAQKHKTDGFVINVLITNALGTEDPIFRLDIVTAEHHGVNLVRLKDHKNLPVVSLPIKLQDITGKYSDDLIKELKHKCRALNTQLVTNDIKFDAITVKRVVRPFPGQTLAHFLKENYEYSTFGKNFIQAFVEKKAADTPISSSLLNDHARLSADQRKAYITGVAATIYSQAENKPATDFIESQGRWFVNSCLNSTEIPKT